MLEEPRGDSQKQAICIGIANTSAVIQTENPGGLWKSIAFLMKDIKDLGGLMVLQDPGAGGKRRAIRIDVGNTF